MDDEFKNKVFGYLDKLRDSGATNMFGAGSFICDNFDVSRKESGELLGEWMRTFPERHKDEENE